MAAGITAEDAEELCDLSMFQGRLCVAAYKVDKAYHSPHMQKVAPGFLDALRRCRIRPRQGETTGDDATAWLSSTYEDTEMRGDMDGDRDLAGPYWVNNLLRPVRFTQAVRAAAASAHGPFDFAIEVGPHVALKGPVLETLREIANGDGEAVP
ncbi:hypothetical protein GGTG_04149 [Gaeumannomyces tritici R3-111a-1]|uniref:Malonyl-CoA:ACP transacylase (MAT) domain-containing protein n=1 Tax=Gaeumannomyces tritici (strain R3-111a-1) TaxID=644352 RepID=J3NSA4_GAET3|nr:hypothetical protein GGTG_04149 [Gaeumannomyces tritici R3-111a-1]EJT79060.1 hypothetical protein GGTG_04149 [Gaeumannomyces tritici R3-111a-1]